MVKVVRKFIWSSCTRSTSSSVRRRICPPSSARACGSPSCFACTNGTPTPRGNSFVSSRSHRTDSTPASRNMNSIILLILLVRTLQDVQSHRCSADIRRYRVVSPFRQGPASPRLLEYICPIGVAVINFRSSLRPSWYFQFMCLYSYRLSSSNAFS